MYTRVSARRSFTRPSLDVTQVGKEEECAQFKGLVYEGIIILSSRYNDYIVPSGLKSSLDIRPANLYP